MAIKKTIKEDLKTQEVSEVKEKKEVGEKQKTKKQVKKRKISNKKTYNTKISQKERKLKKKDIPKNGTTPLGGRPSEYNYDFMKEKLAEYLDTCKDSWYQLDKSKSSGMTSESQSWENKLKVKIPTMEGYAIFTGFALQTIQDWEKNKEGFSVLVNEIRQKQAERLIEGGLSGTYNPTIAKLLLSKHGYVEESKSDIDLKGGLNISFARPATPFNNQKEDKKKK